MDINEKPLDPLFSTVTQIRYPNKQDHATGFFYKDGTELYLITNRHVVRNPDSGGLESEIRIYLRDNPHGDQVTHCDLELADDRVVEHPNETVDIAAVPITINLKEYATFAITPDHLLETGKAPEYRIACGKRALVVGYPFRGTSPYYPVARSTMIATPYGKPFEAKPCFLTDARMHNGMSGSPVLISNDENTHATMDGTQIAPNRITFLGIHSGTYRDPINHSDSEESQMYLNIAWYPELFNEFL